MTILRLELFVVEYILASCFYSSDPNLAGSCNIVGWSFLQTLQVILLGQFFDWWSFLKQPKQSFNRWIIYVNFFLRIFGTNSGNKIYSTTNSSKRKVVVPIIPVIATINNREVIINCTLDTCATDCWYSYFSYKIHSIKKLIFLMMKIYNFTAWVITKGRKLLRQWITN